MISSLSGDNARIPYDIALVELQIEWGLTDEEFDSIDVEKIYKIIEYRSAKAEAENSKIKQSQK